MIDSTKMKRVSIEDKCGGGLLEVESILFGK